MRDGRSTIRNIFKNAKLVDGGHLVSSYQMPSSDTLLTAFLARLPTMHVLLTSDLDSWHQAV
jgi:hypothetical protein